MEKDLLKPVTVHRALLKGEMIDIFRDPSILRYEVDFTIIRHTGVEEEGQGSGILIGVIRTFWQECFSSLTVGALAKFLVLGMVTRKGSGKQLAE